MIDDFKAFSLPHIIAIISAVVIGVPYIIAGTKAATKRRKRLVNISFAGLLIIIRSTRYIMDIIFNRFSILSLFSLQICHISLILMIISLLKPNRFMFYFIFLVGVPTAMYVVLMPGKVHPEPGLARAIMFVMSHAMLVVGAIYIAVTEQIAIRLKHVLAILGIGNIMLIVVFCINKALGTNFLYIMYATEGTVIETLNAVFGWPGYVLFMNVATSFIIFIMFFIHKFVFCMATAKTK